MKRILKCELILTTLENIWLFYCFCHELGELGTEYGVNNQYIPEQYFCDIVYTDLVIMEYLPHFCHGLYTAFLNWLEQLTPFLSSLWYMLPSKGVYKVLISSIYYCTIFCLYTSTTKQYVHCSLCTAVYTSFFVRQYITAFL